MTRIGIRTRRGIRSAVARNRLKRQVRAILSGKTVCVRQGVDLVIVIHPPRPAIRSEALEVELKSLCRKVGALS